MEGYYKLRDENIIFDKMAHQMVIADLENGFYCTLEDPNSLLIWDAILSGFSVEEVKEKLSAFTNNQETCFQFVDDFIGAIVDGKIFISSDEPANVGSGSPTWDTFDSSIGASIKLFDGAATLLQLDPVD